MSKNTDKSITPASGSQAASAATTNDFVEQVYEVRKASTPIVLIRTVDSFATIARIAARLLAETPLVAWDIIRGWYAVNNRQDAKPEKTYVCPGERAIQAAMEKIPAPAPPNASMILNPVDAVVYARYLPGQVKRDEVNAPGSMLFIHDAHEYLSGDRSDQLARALLNLRDGFAVTQRCVVLLGTNFDNLPSQLIQHVTVLEEPLPARPEVERIVAEFVQHSGLTAVNEQDEQEAVAAALGFGAFNIGQMLAISTDTVSRSLKLARLRQAKRQMIKDTPGLQWWDGEESFDDVCGYDQLKKFDRRVAAGRNRPELIVGIDEGALAFSGSKTDSSGVGGKMLGKVLTETQDKKYRGKIHYGVPGVGKSLMMKALGRECGCPVIMLNMAEIENSLVGKSQERLVHVLQIVETVSNGNAFFVLTTNDLESLDTALKARLSSYGIWMFDSPTDEQVRDLFQFYLTKRGMQDQMSQLDKFDYRGWVGREIEWCVQKAWELRMELLEATEYVISGARSSSTAIMNIRRQGEGCTLSTEYAGPYYIDGPRKAQANIGRALSHDV